MSEEKEIIPILDLESFEFTPPGPMGWAFQMTEEDVAKAKQGIQNIIEVEKMLSLDSLVELSSKGQQQYAAESEEIKSLEKQNDYEEEAQQKTDNIDAVNAKEINIEGDEEINNEIDKVVEENITNELDEADQEDINENIVEITHATNDTVKEEKKEQATVERKVKVILPSTPLKGPWLSNDKLKRFRK